MSIRFLILGDTYYADMIKSGLYSKVEMTAFYKLNQMASMVGMDYEEFNSYLSPYGNTEQIVSTFGDPESETKKELEAFIANVKKKDVFRLSEAGQAKAVKLLSLYW